MRFHRTLGAGTHGGKVGEGDPLPFGVRNNRRQQLHGEADKLALFDPACARARELRVQFAEHAYLCGREICADLPATWRGRLAVNRAGEYIGGPKATLSCRWW